MRRLAVLLTSVSIALLSVAAIPAQAGVVPARVHLNALPASFLPTCTPQSAINRMVSYIRTQQQPDGSFPSIGQASTANAVNALVFSGVNPSTVTRDGHSAIDWIYSQTGSLDSTGVAAEFLLALLLAGRSTVAPNGFDYTARVANAYDPATGLYDPNPTGNAYALIALRAAGRPVPPHALSVWAGLQQADGGWSAYIPQQNSDTNTTAVAVIGLILSLRLGPIPSALAYFRTQQSADGGFTFSTFYGDTSDSNSTGLSILALLATGQNLVGWEKSGVDPVKRLLQLQDPSGAFRYSDDFPGDNAFATFQAGQAAGLTRCLP